MKLLEVNEVCNKLQTELERSNKMKKDMEKQVKQCVYLLMMD